MDLLGKDSTPAKEMLLLGDPVYTSSGETSEDLALRATASLVRNRLARLEKSRDEVMTIARSLVTDSETGVLDELRDLGRSGHIEHSRFDLYLGSEASEARLKEDLSRYRILHIAAHGFFDTERPWFSGLVLSGEGSGASSGFLNLIEIATLKLDADIVFLSACDTAKGRVMKAEGIKGTVRSFLLAGAKAVVATQWEVQDEAATLVACDFYGKLFEGVSPVEALRQAKIALLEHRVPQRGVALGSARPMEARFAHPAFWGPFTMWSGTE
jgi:CHAT domain-containing protein